MSLRKQFARNFPRNAFRRIDGVMHIVGKWGSIVRLDDGTYDAWFVKPDRSPLSDQKLAVSVHSKASFPPPIA